ncbi:MAG: FAD-dependent oxidoreductase [Oscillospiraceae bacterium]|nr:FAD-dependent oxidoreductase [Oscillospiraceae bacterium]
MLNKQFKHLLSPYRILDVEIRNRFVSLAHVPAHSKDGMPKRSGSDYWVERAKGGAGLIVIESQAAHPKGQMWHGFVLAYDKRTIPEYREMNKRVHDQGAKIFGQLTHAGHTTVARPPQLLHAPTQMPEPSCRYNTKEMEIDDIKDVIKYFGLSAATQREAGFDGLEIKVGHDGLLRSFASPFFNRRQDEYGGCFENRLRITREVMQEMRKMVGHDYPIGVRLCLDEYTPFGYSLDYGIKLAKTMEEYGFDYINTDAGSFSSFYMEIPPMAIPLGFAIYLSAELKKAVSIPVVAFGRINDPIQAETILAEGNADLIGMCRQLICDPETPIKTMEGRLDDIRHCIACNDGCIYQSINGLRVRCIQNPAASREAEFGIGTLKPAEIRKKIMVIGGGVSGMKAAEIAAARGHEVVLYEKDKILGGQINLAERLPYRSEIEEVSRYLKIQMERLGVQIRLNTKVSLKEVEAEAPDVVLAATGSTAVKADIRGMENTTINIIDVRRALAHPEEIGNQVLVYDTNGHWQAAGMCEYAQKLGSHVICVTPHSELGIDLEGSSKWLLLKRLYDSGFEIYENHRLDSIDKDEVIIEQTYNHKKMPLKGVDTLILAGHSVSDNQLYLELKKKRDNVYAIGDCVAPRMIEQVIFESEELAREL